MSAHTSHVSVRTNKEQEFLNITRDIEDVLSSSGITDGLCYVSSLHTTAGLYINEDDEPLKQDVGEWLNKLAPKQHYHHNHVDPNAEAHLKRILTGGEVVIGVTNGRLDFGTWQKIVFAEFDGPRERKVLVKIVSS